MDNNFQSNLSHKLVRYGMILFSLGLLTGFGIPLMRNPRMELASHLEAVMNGMFLILLGLIWQKLRLSVGALKWGYALSLFGTFTNWVTNLLAAIWGAGAEIWLFQSLGWAEVSSERAKPRLPLRKRLVAAALRQPNRAKRERMVLWTVVRLRVAWGCDMRVASS